ncbi:hypothetical protein [Persicimonas caeni]|nr:hypothetical protein [Persicimonas caeni]
MKHDNDDIWSAPSATLDETSREKPLSYRVFMVVVAVLLSILFSGLGQFFNRQWLKGAIFIVLGFLLWFVLLGWIVHLVALVDAGFVAWRRTGAD